MYTLFSHRYEGQFPSVMPPGFELLKRTYHREIDKIVDYYQNRVFAVRGDHLLCRLLMMSRVPLEYDINRFMEIVYARAPFIAKNFHLTSDKDYGIFHDGVFYGPGNKELIFYNEEYFNPYEANVNWKNLKPIKVLSHQISDLSLLLPDGHVNSSGQGFCAVSINVPMLTCMYRGFLLQQSGKISGEGESNSLLGVNHFVNMYVLPSMLESHIDIVLMNRLNNLFRGKEMSTPLRKYVFPVIDYSDQLDKILEKVIERLDGMKMNYFGYLQNIPSFYYKDMQESLVMPDFAKTRQVWWAMNMSRFETMGFLLAIGGEAGRNSNGTLFNELVKICKYLGRENMLKTLLPPSLYMDISMFMDEIIEMQ